MVVTLSNKQGDLHVPGRRYAAYAYVKSWMMKRRNFISRQHSYIYIRKE